MMTEVKTRVQDSIHIDAPPSEVFDYCLDPWKLFAGDPKRVVDAQVTSGAGTTAHLSRKAGVLKEDDSLDYVEVVPDRRIEIAMQPTMSLRGLKKPRHKTALYTLTHAFEPEDAGTRMTLKVQVHDAPLYERMIDRLEGKGPERIVRNRLKRIAKALEDSEAGA